MFANNVPSSCHRQIIFYPNTVTGITLNNYFFTQRKIKRKAIICNFSYARHNYTSDTTTVVILFLSSQLYLLLDSSATIGQPYPGRCIGADLQFHTGKSLITLGAEDISWCKHTVCVSVVQTRDSSALD